MSKKELKSCPFCGVNEVSYSEEIVMFTDEKPKQTICIKCDCCNAESKYCCYGTVLTKEQAKARVREYWNTRASQQTNDDVWHDKSEKPKDNTNIVVLGPMGYDGFRWTTEEHEQGKYQYQNWVKWCYLDHIINTRQQSVSEEQKSTLYRDFQISKDVLGEQIEFLSKQLRGYIKLFSELKILLMKNIGCEYIQTKLILELIDNNKEKE